MLPVPDHETFPARHLSAGLVMPEGRLHQFKPHVLKYSYQIAPAAARNDRDITALLPGGALSDKPIDKKQDVNDGNLGNGN